MHWNWAQSFLTWSFLVHYPLVYWYIYFHSYLSFFIHGSVGYDFTVFARPELHHIFASRIPRGKLLFGKKVLSIKQNADGVIIRCSDNSSYQGDILVGADGAYSAVRQTLYKQLSRENKLPQCDEEQMSVRGEGTGPKQIVSCTSIPRKTLFPNATVV